MAYWWAIPAAMAAYSALKPRPKTPKPQPIDVSGILAEIDKLYAAQTQSVQANIARNLAGTQAQTSESLAARGVYSSPVSEWSYAQNRQSSANALADALATIASNQASQKASVMSSATSVNAQQAYQAQLAKYQNQIESSNMLTSLLSNAAMAMYGAGKTAPAGVKAPQTIPEASQAVPFGGLGGPVGNYGADNNQNMLLWAKLLGGR